MAKIKYEDWKPGLDALAVIRQAEAICADYRAQGYDLTLRQLYYQFVARDLIRNTERDYKRIGSIINKARMAGLLDWDYIVDRTRNLQSLGHFVSPQDIMRAARDSFRLDRWANQPTRVEVWVEKEALAGVIGQVAERHDVAYFACRGYVSQSEQWAAAKRLGGYINDGQNVVVLHLGDHDPSGIDMTRDIEDRIRTFITQDWLNTHGEEMRREHIGETDDDGRYTVKTRDIIADMAKQCGGRAPLFINRIALNFDQVEQYNPPPNPAKMTDSRVAGYIDNFGDQSWELDALDPATLDALIEEHILELRDDDAWASMEEREATGRVSLSEATDRWEDVVEFLNGEDEDAE